MAVQLLDPLDDHDAEATGVGVSEGGGGEERGSRLARAPSAQIVVVAAAAAVMQSACAASASRLGKGELSRCVLAGESGGAILTEAGGALLVVLLDANANQGLVNVEVKSAAAEVAKHTSF